MILLSILKIKELLSLKRWNCKRKPKHIIGCFYKVEVNSVVVRSLCSKSHTRVSDSSYEKKWRKFKSYHFYSLSIQTGGV